MSLAQEHSVRRVTVVGGGLAGAALTVQLLRQAEAPVVVTILEPRERLGAGVAYSTGEAHHTTNVPGVRMSADPDDADSFGRWLEQHGDPRTGDERDVYPRRWLFGDYVGDVLGQAIAAHPDARVSHRRETARDIVRDARGLTVETDAGSLPSDAVVLATGNLAPSLPAVLGPLAASAGCIVDPWQPGVLGGIPADARVLIVGTGLTMGDTVATLHANGHRGEIVAVSRRGGVPRRGLATPIEPFGDFSRPPTTARGLLRLVRSELKRGAREAGASWYAVLAAARANAWAIWEALPPAEQSRANRHLRHVYELHRHVMAGPIHDVVQGEQRKGSLRILAARLCDAQMTPQGFEIALQPRGGQALIRESFDVVVNCTGPTYAELTRKDPFWASLARRGLVRPDLAGIGPAVDLSGRAIDTAGDPQDDLLLVGTLARSAFGELTGAREISLQAQRAAATLLAAPLADGMHEEVAVRR